MKDLVHRPGGVEWLAARDDVNKAGPVACGQREKMTHFAPNKGGELSDRLKTIQGELQAAKLVAVMSAFPRTLIVQ